jgi:hypothetical protein
MNKIIVLNNNAVQCLKIGDAFEACNFLTEASTLHTQISDGHGRHRRVKHNDYRTGWVFFSGKEVSHMQAEERNDQYGCPPIPYNFALAVRKTCCQVRFTTEEQRCHQCVDDTAVCPCSIAPILWYNLALTCQTLGTQFGGHTKDGMFYFMRANYLYNTVLDICFSETHRFSTNLRSAVLNNMACIYRGMGRYEESRKLLHKLQALLRSVSRPFIYQEECRVFYTNTMTSLDSKDGHTTAGAA